MCDRPPAAGAVPPRCRGARGRSTPRPPWPRRFPRRPSGRPYQRRHPPTRSRPGGRGRDAQPGRLTLDATSVSQHNGRVELERERAPVAELCVMRTSAPGPARARSFARDRGCLPCSGRWSSDDTSFSSSQLAEWLYRARTRRIESLRDHRRSAMKPSMRSRGPPEHCRHALDATDEGVVVPQLTLLAFPKRVADGVSGVRLPGRQVPDHPRRDTRGGTRTEMPAAATSRAALGHRGGEPLTASQVPPRNAALVAAPRILPICPHTGIPHGGRPWWHP